MLNRVSTASLYQQNLSDIGNVQMELAKLNKQISSGYKADSWDQLNGIVERVSGYQTKMDNIDTFAINNTSISARLNASDQAVGQLQDIAMRYASLITSRRGAVSGSNMNFATQANSLLSQIAQSLNTQIAGRFIFSGSNTDTAPVTHPIPNLSTPGTADTNYYNGNSDALTARISESQQIQYGVPGDSPAFQNLIGAIKTALAGDATNDTSLFGRSVDMINEAIKGLGDIKTAIDTNITNIQTVDEQHSSLKLYWQDALGKETSTDIAEASIKFEAHKTVLTATFQAFAGLTKLKLADYL